MIKTKFAICKECANDKLVPVIKGLCKHHYWKSRSNLKKSVKPKSKNSGQMDVFNSIWNKRKHVCFVTGISLQDKEYYVANNNFHWLFHHVLNKGKYRKFKLYEPNIIILHPLVHFDIENLAESDLIAKYPGYSKIITLKEELLKEYTNY